LLGKPLQDDRFLPAGDDPQPGHRTRARLMHQMKPHLSTTMAFTP
jgi:hypothetical protein